MGEAEAMLDCQHDAFTSLMKVTVRRISRAFLEATMRRIDRRNDA
jgi:hypothetical protein